MRAFLLAGRGIIPTAGVGLVAPGHETALFLRDDGALLLVWRLRFLERSVYVIAPRTILVATDFSDPARAALEQGRALAKAFHASLHVLCVVTDPLHDVWTGYTPGAELIEAVEHLRVVARKRLEELVPQDEVATGRLIVATGWGDPSDEILKYVRSHGVDLVVCGTHGRRGWNHLVMGSVAERVVRLAPCPVWTVRGAGAIAAAA